MYIRIFLLLFLLISGDTSNAQGNDGYFLLPGPSATLAPGGKMRLVLKYAQEDGTAADPLELDIIDWMVNGHAIDALTPSEGSISFSDGNLRLSNATYTAPAALPDKNPIAVSVRVKSPAGGMTILICNIKILKAQYKVVMDATTTNEESGEDIALHGEAYTNLKILDDGTFMLEPVDKTRNMNVTVEKGFYVNGPDAVRKLVTPDTYTFPFLFTIAAMNKATTAAPAKVLLNTTAPQTGIVKWLTTTSGGSLTTIVNIDKGTVTTISPAGEQVVQPIPKGMLYAMDNMTQLNLVAGLMTDPALIMQNVNQNIAVATDKMAFAKRLQAHSNDPAYFKTAQGKADMQKAMAANQQLGGNITNASAATKNLDAAIVQKIKNNPGYVGSKQFQQDMARSNLSRVTDEDVLQRPAMAQVTPGIATVKIAGTFNTKGATPFEGQLESEAGPLKTTIKFRVEKL